MSKIGKLPIPLPQEVKAHLQPHQIQITGPLGQLTFPLHQQIQVSVDQNQILITRRSDHRQAKALHGLTRTLISNMVHGVSQGWSKSLKLVGTGYRVSLSDNQLTLKVGYSHPVIIPSPPGITFEVEGNQKIHIKGIDKTQVGQIAAKIRAVRKPEPYKGKGIRYLGEVVRRKPGKAAKVGAG